MGVSLCLSAGTLATSHPKEDVVMIDIGLDGYSVELPEVNSAAIFIHPASVETTIQIRTVDFEFVSGNMPVVYLFAKSVGKYVAYFEANYKQPYNERYTICSKKFSIPISPTVFKNLTVVSNIWPNSRC